MNVHEPYVHQDYPFYSTDGKGNGDVFNSEAEIPSGWSLPNGKTKGGKAPSTAAPAPAPVTAPAASTDETPAVDAAGVPWDPAKHAGTKALTKAGLWRMKVGVTRPEGEGALDL